LNLGATPQTVSDRAVTCDHRAVCVTQPAL
jgi:hypothetical protein